MSTETETAKSLRACIPKKKCGLPTVVHLGSSLPSRHQDVVEMWTPVSPGSDIVSKERRKRFEPPSFRKCKRLRNLYEYDLRYRNEFTLNRSSWKIPGMGGNFLPDQKADVGDTGTKDGTVIAQTGFKHSLDMPNTKRTPTLSPIASTWNKHVRGQMFSNLKPSNNTSNDKDLKRQRSFALRVPLPDVHSRHASSLSCQSQRPSQSNVGSGMHLNLVRSHTDLYLERKPYCHNAGAGRINYARNNLGGTMLNPY